MIRAANGEDLEASIELLVALELFPVGEIEQLRRDLASFFAENNGREFWLVDDDPQLGLSGIAYCAPEKMTDGTWNLYLIGVHKDRRGKGRGTMLLREVERMAESRGGRVLLVETSGTEGFEKSRAFYGKTGFREEARIHDFYKDGDDKIIFWKALTRLGQTG